MFRLVPFAFLLLLAAGASAQSILASSADGRSFVLAEDGTWTEIERPAPLPPPPEPERMVQIGPPPAPAPARTVVGGDGAYSVRLDASRWRESPSLVPGESDLSYQLPFGAGFATTIYEVTTIPLPTIREIVLANAREGMGATVEILSEKKVTVPGGTGLRLEFSAVAAGIDVTMTNTMYSGDWGTLQVITWTSNNVLDRYRDELLRFQDAITIQPASGE